MDNYVLKIDVNEISNYVSSNSIAFCLAINYIIAFFYVRYNVYHDKIEENYVHDDWYPFFVVFMFVFSPIVFITILGYGIGYGILYLLDLIIRFMYKAITFNTNLRNK